MNAGEQVTLCVSYSQTLLMFGTCLHVGEGDITVSKLGEQVWERLTRYGLSRSEPWFIIGDLNEITGNHEKEGGSLRNAVLFIPFNNMIRNSGLLEFPARGNKLSLQGRRGKGKRAITVRCRLDRALANEEWHTLPIFIHNIYGWLGLITGQWWPISRTKFPGEEGNFGLINDGSDKKVLWNQLLWAGRIVMRVKQWILLQKLAVVAMKLLSGVKTIPHMERIKLMIFKKLLKRYKQMITRLRRKL